MVPILALLVAFSCSRSVASQKLIGFLLPLRLSPLNSSQDTPETAMKACRL